MGHAVARPHAPAGLPGSQLVWQQALEEGKMLSCKQVTELVSQAHDRHLSFREWLGIRIHLFTCTMCARYKKQLGIIVKAIRQYLQHPETLDTPHTQLSQKARERINKAIDSG